MNNCDLLSDWLRNQLSNRIRLSFEDIEDEDRVGVKLPLAAKEHRSWWERDSRHYRAWVNAGWHIESVDLSAQAVVFVRNSE